MSEEGQQRRGRWTSRWSRVAVVAVAVGGVVLSVLLSRARVAWEARLMREAFEAESENIAFVLERELSLYLEVLDSLGRLHSISTDVNQEAFGEFVRKGLLYHRNVLGVFGWAPRVVGPERPFYEAAMQRAGHEDFMIVEKGPPVGFIRAEASDEYFPVSYIEPANVRGIPLGWNLRSDERNRLALESARDEGRSVASSSRGLPEEAGGENSRFVFSPIYYADVAEASVDERRKELAGFVYAVVRPEQIIKKSLSYMMPAGIDLFLFDRTGPAGEQLLYRMPEDDPSAGLPFPGEQQPGESRSDIPIQTAGLNWLLICRPSAEFEALHTTNQPLWILGIGLVFTFLLTTHLGHLASHAARVEREVRERTSELRTANEQLTQNIAERRRLEKEVLDISSREKRRVGQDLHDSLGQQLTGIGFLSSALTRTLKAEGVPAAESAERIALEMKEAISQVRRIARGLAPVDMEEEGLENALRRLADDSSQMFGLRCELKTENVDLILDRSIAINLYHIAQEAVNNAARHGRPSSIQIDLLVDGNEGVLQVEDDGCGIRPKPGSSRGMGLKIMQYRADIIGGTLDVSSRNGSGTVVTCKFDTEPKSTGAE